MSKVPKRDSKQELLVRRFLFAHGFRFRKNDKRLPGSPDIVLPKYKAAIFVHGCFWHGHEGCRAARLPTTRKEFWKAKIQKNVVRDRNKENQLDLLDWRVIKIWQCEVKNKELAKSRLSDLIREITE